MDNAVALPLADEVRALALAVIALAVADFRKHPDWATYQFLTGQTEIGQFWWSAAELLPLSGTTSMEEARRLLACKKPAFFRGETHHATIQKRNIRKSGRQAEGKP